jgi:WD40 repeat protein
VADVEANVLRIDSWRAWGLVAAALAVGCGVLASAPAPETALSPTLTIPRNPITHDDPVFSVSWSPDGKTLASASADTTVKLWEAGTGKEQATLKGHTAAVSSVSWGPDGKTLASASFDKTVRLWDVATGKEKDTLKGHTRGVLSVSWSPDGKTLASASFDKTVRLWDVSPADASK